VCRNDEDADDDDDVSPEDKAVREKLRRQQNNARERYCTRLTEENAVSECIAPNTVDRHMLMFCEFRSNFVMILTVSNSFIV